MHCILLPRAFKIIRSKLIQTSMQVKENLTIIVSRQEQTQYTPIEKQKKHLSK